MSSFDVRAMESTFTATGLRRGDLVMIHSALFALGRLEQAPIKALPARLYQAIRDQIGPTGTVVVPTFNFAFCEGREFDRRFSPASEMGVFAEYIRQQPQARRSPHPMQSVAAIGPLAQEITDRDTASAFEPGSSFDALLDHDARLVMLGCGIEAVSLVHWAEEKVGVPYRHWKSFSGPYRDGRWSGQKSYRMYARDLRLDPTVRLEKIARHLRRAGYLRRLRLGAGAVEACRARDFSVAALKILRRNPRALIDPIDPNPPRRRHVG